MASCPSASVSAPSTFALSAGRRLLLCAPALLALWAVVAWAVWRS